MHLRSIVDKDGELTRDQIYEGTLYDHWLMGYCFITFNDAGKVDTYNAINFEPCSFFNEEDLQ